MEKSIFRFLIFILIIQCGFSQDSLCVYRFEGDILLKSPQSTKPISKGDIVTKEYILNLFPKSQITVIDKEGNIFKRDQEGLCDFNTLLLSKFEGKTSSLTTKYFKFIWDELLNRENTETKIAGVFRGDALMSTPEDQSFITGKTIEFNWKESDKGVYYFYLQNLKTNELFQTETENSFITFDTKNSFFSNDTEYKWTVTTEEFPNLKNIPYNFFSIVDSKQFSELKKEHKSLIKDLKKLGVSESEINSVLCDTYKLCTF